VNHVHEAITLAPLAISEFQPSTQWGGRTVAVNVDPNNANVAVTAAESGGLFKTTNGGASWAHLAGLQPFRMVDVAISPRNANLMIATAVNDTRTVNGGGIWRSTDGGVTWQKPASSTPAACPRASAWGIAYAPDVNSIFVGTDCGVAVSTDSGATWTHVQPDPTLGNQAIYSLVAQAGGLVDILGNNGHYRSTTGGAAGSWTATNNQPGPNGTGGGGISTHSLAVSPLSSSILFAATDFSTGTQVWESDDGGSNWTALNPPLQPRRNRPPYIVAHVSGDGNPQHLDLFYGDGVSTLSQTCTNTAPTGLRCGSTWNFVNMDHTDASDMAYAPGNNCPVFQSGDFGIQTTADCGLSWTTTINGSWA